MKLQDKISRYLKEEDEEEDSPKVETIKIELEVTQSAADTLQLLFKALKKYADDETTMNLVVDPDNKDNLKSFDWAPEAAIVKVKMPKVKDTSDMEKEPIEEPETMEEPLPPEEETM